MADVNVSWNVQKADGLSGPIDHYLVMLHDSSQTAPAGHYEASATPTERALIIVDVAPGRYTPSVVGLAAGGAETTARMSGPAVVIPYPVDAPLDVQARVS